MVGLKKEDYLVNKVKNISMEKEEERRKRERGSIY